MRIALAVAIGVGAAAVAGAVARQQAPPQPQGTVRLPSVQFTQVQQGQELATDGREDKPGQ